MKKFVFTFCLGMLVGLAIVYFNRPEKKKIITEIPTAAPASVAKQTPENKKMDLLKTEKLSVAKTSEENPISAEAAVPPKIETPEAKPVPARQITLDISEETVLALEQNIEELRRDVSLYREDKGWVVRYHSPQNILSHIGVQDNDLIRYNQFDDMKNDPTAAPLVSRLQEVLATLER